MTALLRILLRCTPGDLAGLGCVFFIALSILVGTP